MVYSTHLTNEAMPEPGTLLRVVSVHPSNRTFETVPVGHDPGWLVSDPAGTNSLYWTDGEVSEEHPGWVRGQNGMPAAVISRHGAQPEPEPSAPSPPSRPVRRGRRFVGASTTPTDRADEVADALTENTGGATNVETSEGEPRDGVDANDHLFVSKEGAVTGVSGKAASAEEGNGDT